MRDADRHPANRLLARGAIVERIEGKIPERLQVSSDQPWQVVLDGIVAEVPQEALERGRNTMQGAVDGEVVDVEFEDDLDDEPPPRTRSRRRKP